MGRGDKTRIEITQGGQSMTFTMDEMKAFLEGLRRARGRPAPEGTWPLRRRAIEAIERAWTRWYEDAENRDLPAARLFEAAADEVLAELANELSIPEDA